MEKKVIANQLYIDRWIYSEPKLEPDKDGKTVIVSKSSFGPCEYFEWGVMPDKTYFEKYKWSEDDYFDNSSYTESIDKNKLIEVIQNMKALVQGTSLEYWNDIYDEFIKKLDL